MLPPTIFIVSDGTGITAETFAHSILSQFNLQFRLVRLPFIDSPEKAETALEKINQLAIDIGSQRPIVFTTLVNSESNDIIKRSHALVLDMLQTFIEPLEQELNIKSSHQMGQGHKADTEAYKNRIEAINFSLAHDDGQSNANLEMADIILVGVSRSGKTPTSLYLAMQYGVKVANYPLIPEDFKQGKLPRPLAPYKAKIFGLSIEPERLVEIRNERRPGSQYASPENCRYEVSEAQALMRREGIQWLSSTHKSIEEIATTLLQEVKLDKPPY